MTTTSCLLTLGMVFTLLCPIPSLPAPNHNIQKRVTEEILILGDLTAGHSGVLNQDGVPSSSCLELRNAGYGNSGYYIINPGGKEEFIVFCDMNLRGGGWTVIQRRVDDTVSFNKTWEEYKLGFGSFNGNFWLGLEKMRLIADAEPNELYIGLQSYSSLDEFAWARYASFSLGDETAKYKLTLGAYNTYSTAGDAFDAHSGNEFSAKDEDNDLSTICHCAQKYSSGWWYHNLCHNAHLNGIHYPSPGDLANPSIHDGIIWQDWRGDKNSLKTAVMALRPVFKTAS